MDPDTDPGWEISPWMVLFLVPGYLQFKAARELRTSGDGLAMIRQVWMTFAAALVLIGVVAVVVAPNLVQGSATGWLPVLVAAAAGLLVAEQWVLTRPLSCTDLDALASSYRSRFFLAVAFSEAIALAAFAATIATGQAWLYWTFLPVALVGHLRAAPTTRRIRTVQEQLHVSGCALSLVRALRGASG